jgi:hypothetical protein
MTENKSSFVMSAVRAGFVSPEAELLPSGAAAAYPPPRARLVAVTASSAKSNLFFIAYPSFEYLEERAAARESRRVAGSLSSSPVISAARACRSGRYLPQAANEPNVIFKPLCRSPT